jgi:hypothetical protein
MHRQIDFIAVTLSEANLSTNNRPREVCQFAALTSRIAREVLIHSEFSYTIFDTDQRAPSSRHEAFDGVQPQTRRAVRTSQKSIRRLESSAPTRAGCSQNEMTVGSASSRIHCSRPTKSNGVHQRMPPQRSVARHALQVSQVRPYVRAGLRRYADTTVKCSNFDPSSSAALPS